MKAKTCNKNMHQDVEQEQFLDRRMSYYCSESFQDNILVWGRDEHLKKKKKNKNKIEASEKNKGDSFLNR